MIIRSAPKVLLISLLTFGSILATGAETESTLDVRGQRFPVIAGCGQNDYVFVDAPEVKVELSNVEGGRGYYPHCLKVRRGTKVSIPGTEHHPILAMGDMRGVVNPFPSQVAAQAPAVRKLDQPGFYGYYCVFHSDATGNGMAGMIIVE